MSWLQSHPDDLIERVEPTEALQLLRQQTPLDLGQVKKLDIYLHHWTLLVLQRSDDPEGVQEMLTLSEIAQARAPAGEDGEAARVRWGCFEELLEGKRKQLQARQFKPPVQLKQQDTLLQLIAQSDKGRIKQSDLVQHLALSKGRVSQILGLLESRSLVTRQREGKESWVMLTPAKSTSDAQLATRPTTAPQNQPQAVNIKHSVYGASVFVLDRTRSVA